MSADPNIDGPMNTQGWNRYSYVFNNPLSYTDPTGYFSFRKFFKRWLRPIAAIAVAVFAPQFLGVVGDLAFGAAAAAGATTGTAMGLANAAISATAGFLSGAVATGSLRGAVQGAFSAGLFYGAGSIGAGYGSTARVVAHAGAGCLSSVAAGGSCGSGAAGSLLSISTEGVGHTGHRFIDATARGVVGGVGSVAAGGSFGAGFANGVAAYAFNCLSHPGPCTAVDGPEISAAAAKCYPLDSSCVAPLGDMAREARMAGVPAASMSATLGDMTVVAATGATAGAAQGLGSPRFNGPSRGLAYGNGRVFGVTFARGNFRIGVDLQPYPGTNGASRLHLNVGGTQRGQSVHIPLDPRRIADLMRK